MRKILATCLQADLVEEVISHHLEFLEDDIDVWCLPGIIRKFLENRTFNRKLLMYDQIYLTGHQECGYYDIKGFKGISNELQQKKDIEIIKNYLSLTKKAIFCQSEFIKIDNQDIIINNSSYYKKHDDSNAEFVLIYPVENWKNSFQLMENTFTDSKYDRYGYFSEGASSLESNYLDYISDIKNISIKHHHSTKLIFLVKKCDSKNSFIQKFYKQLRENFASSAIFVVNQKTKEKVLF